MAKKTEQWESDLRRQLHGVAARKEKWEKDLEKVVAKAPALPHRHCVLAAAVLFVTLVVAYGYRTGIFPITQTCPAPNKNVEVQHLRAECDALSTRLTAYEEKLRLLGIVVCENFAALRQCDRDFILLNRDWTIPKSPKYLEMTDKDREFIQRHTSPRR